MRKQPIEILVPTWPALAEERFWGDRRFKSHRDIESAWISLRSNDNWSDAGRAVNDLALYVWFNADKSVSIDLRMHGTGSITLREAESRVKLLRKLKAKIQRRYQFLDSFARDADVGHELVKVLNALGVKRSVQYHGIGVADTFVPIEEPLKVIVTELRRRAYELQKEAA